MLQRSIWENAENELGGRARTGKEDIMKLIIDKHQGILYKYPIKLRGPSSYLGGKAKRNFRNVLKKCKI